MAPLGYVYKAEEEFSPQSAADEEPDSSLRAGGKFRKMGSEGRPIWLA